jgi:predicted enzyme involved in methoxymalonyl-ACP biosynthesis
MNKKLPSITVPSCFKNRILKWHTLDNYVKEIFSSWTHKTEHFQKIQRKTGIPYKSMLFFDDEDRNIETVTYQFLVSYYCSLLVTTVTYHYVVCSEIPILSFHPHDA